MSKNKLLFAFILLISIKCFSQHKVTDWELKKNENDIAVYTRHAENSAFKELKSDITIKTSLSSIIALLTDYESYTKWVYKCGESTTLKKINDTTCIHYQTVVAPWPASDRDFVVTIKETQNPKTKIINITSTCNATYIPNKDGFVRIKNFNAKWSLTPLKDGLVEIEYQLLVDPGGAIPAWLVNLAVVDGPFETMVGFKKFIIKDKYQKAKISYIKEPDI
ncbi:MAG: START domain-containing protein [Bacteroidia bacterium]